MPDGAAFALPPALPRIAQAIARAVAPRKPLTVSQWADAERVLSSKGSAEPGRWRTSRNEALREPMDCLSKRSGVKETVLILPIQMGKTEWELNALGYCMDHDPGPLMVVLPDDITMNNWINQKLATLLETPAVQRALTSTASRDSSNQKAFKDFAGGQLYIEHGKTPSRMALKSIRTIFVDELDKFAAALTSGEDPLELIRGRSSAFPTTHKHAYCGTPGIRGLSKLEDLYEASDQRLYHVPCPHCGQYQPLEWSGLQYTDDASECWYMCAHNQCVIREHDKPQMIARGRWIARKPEVTDRRGYRLNCLYYPIGLGPRWLELVHMWRAAQGDPAKLQVFVCERLAEAWEDPAMRSVKDDLIADRAEGYALRTAPEGVLAVTAGVDTQDNRLAVQIVGWGRGLRCWVLDYVELPGDPTEDKVWDDLADLLNRGIEHASGLLLPIEAVAIDAGGHRTEDVKAFVRARRVRRPLCIFGAVPNNAPVLKRGQMVDVNWRGKLDKRGLQVYQVGTVAIKHWLYARLGADADFKTVDGERVAKTAEDRFVHLSDALPRDYFGGLVGEVYNPAKNRFQKRKGAPRNEPLDTWVYAFAAAHHPELRLHRLTKLEWDAREKRIAPKPEGSKDGQTAGAQPAPEPAKPVTRGTSLRGARRNFATKW